MNNEITVGQSQDATYSIATAKMRIALVITAVASVIFPAITITAMGMFSQGIGLPALAGSIAYMIPLAFVVALAARFTAQLKPYSRLIDIVAAAFCVLFLLWGIWSLFEAYSAIAQQDRAMASIMGGNSGFQAPRASDFGSFTPSIGAFALVATAVLSVLQARKTLGKTA